MQTALNKQQVRDCIREGHRAIGSYLTGENRASPSSGDAPPPGSSGDRSPGGLPEGHRCLEHRERHLALVCRLSSALAEYFWGFAALW